MNKTIKFLGTLTAAALLTGCGASEYSPSITTTPAEMFADGCQSCHGEKGTGKFGLLLRLAGSDESIEHIAAKIEKGGMVMSSFPGINTAQRLALATYIKTL
ncbi:MAG: cytochrome C [Gammaproteobacteria bacterium (ex Lamellibrachia satsuma)]|nr:MAG: cytochrome c [Gammaproteobacteria bacterium (ex Lamellibrachia satsuma)]RRS34013.1 MAG: cytochrome C [Gammaproteobacteria bacterium (ex Lamellibrachia satsuma)]RRS35551.1 MAG: cytochrome C [Gammaproteobacteria bacterium (ex Lamellibrachia satsuma)]